MRGVSSYALVFINQTIMVALNTVASHTSGSPLVNGVYKCHSSWSFVIGVSVTFTSWYIPREDPG